MKGIIFSKLGEMVESQYGLEFWDKVITESDLPSKGIYTSGGTYPDAEFYTLIKKIAEKTHLPEDKFIQKYGEYLFEKLSALFPDFFVYEKSLKKILKSIDRVIHVEVFKLYPSAELPNIQYEDPSENELVMIYSSPRKLCALAKGLILGAATKYEETVDIHETKCMHKGDNHCRLELKFSKTEKGSK